MGAHAGDLTRRLHGEEVQFVDLDVADRLRDHALNNVVGAAGPTDHHYLIWCSEHAGYHRIPIPTCLATTKHVAVVRSADGA